MSFDELKKQASVPDAEDNLAAFEKHMTCDWQQDSAQNLARIFFHSRFLSRFLLNHPQSAKTILENKDIQKEFTPSEYLNSANAFLQQSPDWKQNLRLFKYTQLLRLTILEIIGTNSIQVYRELSTLAQTICQLCFEKICSQFLEHVGENKLPCESAILAMGKLGGFELNYSSDIDLIGFYQNEGSLKNTNHHEFFVKLFLEFGKELNRRDPIGFLYRADWDLRPEGIGGTLANSFVAMETYYESFGEEWERQAYIKARPLIETKNIGSQFLETLTPFVYRKSFDEKTIKNIWAMKSRIQKENAARSSKAINIKLDAGGIRDIEFFVQGFQLLYGGQYLDLRSTNTLIALNTLSIKKLISKSEQEQLQTAYLFLRRLESMIQMEEEAQRHSVSEEASHQLALAKRMGFTGSRDEIISKLNEALLLTRTQARQIFEKYFKQE